MFRSIFSEYGIAGAYVRCAIGSAGGAARIIRELKFSGMNITAPFKESITPYLDTISGDAKSIGAVNTIVCRDETLTGYNTDHLGVTEPLEMRTGNLAGKKTLVLGAGGAGIAAAYGLKYKGADVIILNKFEEPGAAAAARTDAVFRKLDLLGNEIQDADIIINTIPYEIGPLDITGIKSGAIFFDAGYKKSHYSGLAAKMSFEFIGGEEWLIHQGIHACRHFLGFLPERRILSSALEEVQGKKSIESHI